MNKANGNNKIPIELFQILKDDAVKVLHSICQQIWKTQQWPQDWKRSVFIPIPKKGNAKECSNYCTLSLISYASKVTQTIFQARLQQYVNCELPDVQACQEPAREFPPMTRSCRRALMGKVSQDSRGPLDLLKHLPQNQNLSVLLFYNFHQLL